jgi:hypothetical protein
MEIPEFSMLNLVGGTSLALQIGHRKSLYIDLFGKFKLDDYQFSTTLRQFGSVTQLNNSQNIKTYLINNIKVDFVNYPYSWIAPIHFKDDIRLACTTDIAAMKFAAITGRGTKKDFIDIFSLLPYYSLEQMLEFYHKKFPDGSEFMVLKSLTYFEDAESEEPPVLIKKIDWEEVKSTIITETKKYISSR